MDEDNQQDDQGLAANNIEDQLKADLEAATNNWKRAMADFENYKRRKESENKELVEFAREVTVVKLLPALDSLVEALKYTPEYPSHTRPSLGDQDLSPTELESYRTNFFAKSYHNWQAGITSLLKQLDKTLAELGIKKIEAVGKKFDPHFHEAIREVESDKDDGIIIDEVQTGFELNGKVIRPSQVVISKKSQV